MVAYRGVSQPDIINSIIAACELAQKNSPGPACDKEIDALLADIPALQKAADDKEFRSALNGSNVHILLRMTELFETYAAANTDGVGRKVLENLDTWGAFNGGITHELRPMDEEINIYRFKAGVRNIKAVDEEQVREIVNQSSYVTNEAEITKGIADLRSVVSLAQSGASDRELVEAYEQLGVDRAKGRIVRLAVETLNSDPTIYAANTPLFGRYGVVLADMVTGARFDTVMKQNEGLIKSVHAVLAPFYETDEIQMTGVGMITMDPKDTGGIVFVATERVARAIADAFPDEKVLRADGGTVTPSTGAPASKKPQGPGVK